jgi:hypothetical protein
MTAKLNTDDILTLAGKMDDLKLALANIVRPPEQVILDDVDLRDFLKVSKRTTASWREKGIITFSKLGGKIYYRLSDILYLLKENEVPAVNANLKIAL